MSKKQFSPYRGADLRAMRDVRTAAAEDPIAQARRHESSFLRNVAAAGEDYAWILENEAWLRLGFDTFVDWYEQRVAPIAARLGLRPAREQAKVAIEKAAEEQKALPRDQRRPQRELARLFGVSQTTISRAVGDSNESNDSENGQAIDPLDAVPAAREAVNDFLNNQASGENRPGTADPGEAEGLASPSATDGAATPSDAQPPADSLGESAGDETGSEAPPVSEPVDEPERADDAGVSSPPAPDSDIPNWLRALTAVCTAVHGLAEEKPAEVAAAIDCELAAELGTATSRLRTWYTQMQTALNEADDE